MSMVMGEDAVHEINKSNEQLVARIRAGEDEAENMLQLWQQNQGFIAKIAMRYQGYAEMDDLKQEGYFGLCEAVRQYDVEQGVAFISYAAFWIRQAMKRYIDNCCGVVRLPVHAHEWIDKYNKVVKEYQKYYGDLPPESALCALLGVGREKLHDIQESARMGQIRSLSEPISGEDEGITLSDTVASGEDMEEDIIKKLDTVAMEQELWIAVDQLPDNLPAVIRSRYQDGKTLKETGQCLGIGIERARQIEAKAMRGLRNGRKSRRIKGYYEEYLKAQSFCHIGVDKFKRTWTSETERDALKLYERSTGSS